MRLEQIRGFNIIREEMETRLEVEMYYLPTLSDNRYKTARGITRSEVKRWMNQLGWVVGLSFKSLALVPPVKVRIDGFFRDGRRPDLQNFFKVVCDGIKTGIPIDDRDYTVESGDVGRVGKVLLDTITGKVEAPGQAWLRITLKVRTR